MGPQLKRTSKCVRLLLLVNTQTRPYHVFVSLDAKVVDFLLCLADLVDVGAAMKSNAIGNFLISKYNLNRHPYSQLKQTQMLSITRITH